MYYSLIDLLRSPELIKRIGQEYLHFMVDNREQLVKQQIWIVKRDMLLEEKKKQEELKELRRKKRGVN